MSKGLRHYTGGCLCGAVRYDAAGEPAYSGHCYCGDCRKASGSGFIPFMSYPASAVSFTGEPRQHVVRSARGTDAVRNFCTVCGGLVFGGRVGIDTEHTIYAGTLTFFAVAPARTQPRRRPRYAWAARACKGEAQ